MEIKRNRDLVVYFSPSGKPGLARPSMSGFGINVSKLMKAAGMPYGMITHESEETKTSMATVCGLVIIG